MTEPDFTLAKIDRSGAARFQRLRRDLGVESFGMNAIVLQPGQRGRIHLHELQEEVYLVLDGELTLVIEGDEHKLRADELARVGPGTRRQLVNAGTERVVLLALGGAGRHDLRDALGWSSWEDSGPGRPPQELPQPEDLPPR